MSRSRAIDRRGSLRSSYRRKSTSRHRRPMPEWLEPRIMLAFTPQLIADINQDPAPLELPSYGFGGFVVAGSDAFFTKPDASFGSELWKSDGTGAGTGRIKDIYPG